MKLIDLLYKPNSSGFETAGLCVLALILLVGAAPPLAAQSTTSGPAGGTETALGSDQQKPAAQEAPKTQAASEAIKLGAYEVHSEFELGYRYSSGVGGNSQMYRSQVNLFSGARLLRSSVSLRATPGTGIVDRMDLSVDNWGDPYNTMRFSIGRMDLYDFKASYRNLNYYNYISTLDNPLLGQGNLLPQHTLNVNYQMSNFDLRLFPNHKIVPFVGFSRSTSTGPGLTTIGTTGNEFVLNTNWLTATDEFHGGIQLNLTKLSLTLDQGYLYAKNDTGVTDLAGSQGNENNNTFLGQPIVLNSLNRGYHGRTKLPTSRILAKFTPFQNLRMIGRYIYSIGNTDANMGEIRTGGFVDLENFLAYSAAADGINGRAKRPNHNGSFLIEYSPSSRVTLRDNVDTLDYHISGAGVLSTLFLNASSLFGPGPTQSKTVNDALNTQFAYNQVRNQAEIEVDLGYGLAARAGHKYTYLEFTNDDSDDKPPTTAFHSQSAVSIGLTYRPGRWLRMGFDYEKTRPDAAFTRTELYEYDQFNFDMRIGAWKGLSFNGKVGFQRNTNPAGDIDFHSRDQNYTGSVNYELNERVNVSVDFSRTNLFSDLLVVLPQSLSTTRSIFDQRVMGMGGRMGLTIYKGIKTEFGYRGVFNKGSFPLEFHQPFASIYIPLKGGLAFKPTWQYFGYHQDQFGFENYQTHLVTFALVFSR
jgi:hypothetical protein